MKLKFLLLLIVAISFTIGAMAQIGINTLSPDTSAALDVFSSDKGLLIPRMSAVQRVALPMKYTPADGLMVYDTTCSMFFYWSKAQNNWEAINPMQFTVDDLGNNSDLVLKSATIGNKNVGIGVDNPSQKLHVNGNIQADGNVIVTQNISAEGSISANSNITTNSNITASQTITANYFVGNGTIPIGGIIMWSGSVIPDGWALCNGQIVDGVQTPNLQDRFIVGSGNNYNIGDSAGKNIVALTIQNMPRHNHGGGNHDHSASTTLGYYKDKAFSWGPGQGMHEASYNDSDGDYLSYASCSTSISLSNNIINYQGDSQSHENRPPYYSLAFIMRVR